MPQTKEIKTGKTPLDSLFHLWDLRRRRLLLIHLRTLCKQFLFSLKILRSFRVGLSQGQTRHDAIVIDVASSGLALVRISVT